MEKTKIESEMKKLAKILKYKYDNIKFLSKAMNCQKVKNLDNNFNSTSYVNEKFAFVGDAVLDLVIADYLSRRVTFKNQMSEKKQDVVKNTTLAKLCNQLNIFTFSYNDKYFYDENLPAHLKLPHSKHDVFIEAIIGAVFKDKGYSYTYNWLIDLFKKNNVVIC